MTLAPIEFLMQVDKAKQLKKSNTSKFLIALYKTNTFQLFNKYLNV